MVQVRTAGTATCVFVHIGPTSGFILCLCRCLAPRWLCAPTSVCHLCDVREASLVDTGLWVAVSVLDCDTELYQLRSGKCGYEFMMTRYSPGRRVYAVCRPTVWLGHPGVICL
ncbi:hypothetical protein F4861DRAFT_510628 [Xylaria intraflava]|nr:hypothetical protein F4861DRAFT_510628 [Xylaria intraflava]